MAGVGELRRGAATISEIRHAVIEHRPTIGLDGNGLVQIARGDDGQQAVPEDTGAPVNHVRITVRRRKTEAAIPEMALEIAVG